jgi:branched-chain amino acid transport system permease protein
MSFAGRRAVLLLLLLIAAVVLPPYLGIYYTRFATLIAIYGMAALSVDLLLGYTGLITFGQAAFFGIGAYAAGMLTVYGVTNALVVWPLAMLITMAFALVIGSLALRTREFQFIMVTLAFAQMAFFVFHDTPVGGGTDGIYLNLRPVLALGDTVLIDLDNGRQLYYFTLAALVLTYGLLALILRSRFGRALVGIRVNEQRMRAAGFNTYAYKLAAFIIAGMLAGIAGFLSATKNGIVNPELLSWHESGAVLLMIILGGLGSLRGAVVGTVAFVLLKECYSSEAIFGDFAHRWQLTVGLTMIFLVAMLPDGLIGLGARLRAKAGAPR